MNSSRALRHAAVFHAIARSGSIAAAAQQLGRSPPAIHHDLKLLETELGRPLFARVGRGLKILPGAIKLFESIGRSLDEIERARLRFESGAAGKETVRVASVSAFGRYVLMPRLLAALPPDQPLELMLDTHERVLEAVQSGRVDFAITYRPVSVISIEARPIAQEDYVLLGSELIPAESTLAMLERQIFITYDEYEYVFARWFEMRFGRQPRRLRRGDHTTELEEALECVAAGRGLSIVPADAWKRGPISGRCVELLSDRAVTNELFLLSAAGAPPVLADQLAGMWNC